MDTLNILTNLRNFGVRKISWITQEGHILDSIAAFGGDESTPIPIKKYTDDNGGWIVVNEAFQWDYIAWLWSLSQLFLVSGLFELDVDLAMVSQIGLTSGDKDFSMLPKNMIVSFLYENGWVRINTVKYSVQFMDMKNRWCIIDDSVINDSLPYFDNEHDAVSYVYDNWNKFKDVLAIRILSPDGDVVAQWDSVLDIFTPASGDLIQEYMNAYEYVYHRDLVFNLAKKFFSGDFDKVVLDVDLDDNALNVGLAGLRVYSGNNKLEYDRALLKPQIIEISNLSWEEICESIEQSAGYGENDDEFWDELSDRYWIVDLMKRLISEWDFDKVNGEYTASNPSILEREFYIKGNVNGK